MDFEFESATIQLCYGVAYNHVGEFADGFALRFVRRLAVVTGKKLSAILVDRIEEMAEMRAIVTLPRSFQGDERVWYRGLTILEGKVVPVVDPKGFLTADETSRLEERVAEQHETADSVHGGGEIS